MKIRDLVRVRQSGGGLSDTRYEIVTLGPGASCTIREWPGIRGKRMAEQPFDTSLLAVDNTGPKLLADLFRRRA